MKCIKKDDKVMRVSDTIAESRVKHEGFQYVSKTTYKEFLGKPTKDETVLDIPKNKKLTRSEKRILKNHGKAKKVKGS